MPAVSWPISDSRKFWLIFFILLVSVCFVLTPLSLFLFCLLTKIFIGKCPYTWKWICVATSRDGRIWWWSWYLVVRIQHRCRISFLQIFISAFFKNHLFHLSEGFCFWVVALKLQLCDEIYIELTKVLFHLLSCEEWIFSLFSFFFKSETLY